MKETWRRLFDRLAPTYEKDYTEHPFWILYNEITWANIKKYLPQEKRWPILDAGGGTGFWSRKLAELGYKVICADVSSEMLNEGRKMVKDTSLASRIDFAWSDITDMKEFPDKNFSLVLAEGDPLSYCGDPDKAVKEMARVAKPGTYVIASVDSFFGALGRMFKNRDLSEVKTLIESGKTTYQENCFQYNFTAEELERLFIRHELEVVDIMGKPIFTLFIPWEKMGEVLRDKERRRRILELELKYYNNPSIVGLGGHLEIVGRRR